MRRRPFEDVSLDGYIDWVVDNAQRFEGVELRSEGSTTEERAQSLVEDMIGKGLASASVGAVSPESTSERPAASKRTRRPTTCM